MAWTMVPPRHARYRLPARFTPCGHSHSPRLFIRLQRFGAGGIATRYSAALDARGR